MCYPGEEWSDTGVGYQARDTWIAKLEAAAGAALRARDSHLVSMEHMRQQAINAIDTDGDGSVSLNEFCRMEQVDSTLNEALRITSCSGWCRCGGRIERKKRIKSIGPPVRPRQA